MKTMIAVLLLCAASAGAAVQTLTGSRADLDNAVFAKIPALGKVTPAAGALAVVAAQVKGGLVGVAFNDVAIVAHEKGQTTFVGHHVVLNGSDFAYVTFPENVEISALSAADVIGTFKGTKTMTAANGQKMTLPVIVARVVGVIDGASTGGAPIFAPNSAIRIYEKAAKAASSKKKGASAKP
jgi:hypothetical protein